MKFITITSSSFPHYSQLIIPGKPRKTQKQNHTGQALSNIKSTIDEISASAQRTGYLLPHATKSFTRLRSSGSGFTFQNVARRSSVRRAAIVGDRVKRATALQQCAIAPRLCIPTQQHRTAHHTFKTLQWRGAYTLPIPAYLHQHAA